MIMICRVSVFLLFTFLFLYSFIYCYLDTKRRVAADSKTIWLLCCLPILPVFFLMRTFINFRSLCILLAANKYVFIHLFIHSFIHIMYTLWITFGAKSSFFCVCETTNFVGS